MLLQKQVHIHSVDTSAFYNDQEKPIHKRLSKGYILRSKIRMRREKIHKKYDKSPDKYSDEKEYIDELYSRINKYLSRTKDKLYIEFKKQKGARSLSEENLGVKSVVSIFDSVLTRTIEMNVGELSKELFIVQTYFFEVLESLVLNGFYYNNEKYIVYTASAGQIRTKKTVFIKESTWKKYEKSLTCGLTDELINMRGTININKYLAYKALQNSATDLWVGFDINKAIVVDDFETMVKARVDFIDDETYEIVRKVMDVLIPHMDGCGIMLGDITKMARLPWIKGLMVPFEYDEFIRYFSKLLGYNCGIVKDIYGKEYDVIKDDIRYIFTKSQFKMYKFYKDWDEYKTNFIKHNCQAAYCNEEEGYIKDAKINYQMLQTLVDITDSELESLSKKTNDNIAKVTHDKNTMMKLLGAVVHNKNKNSYQKAIQYYPQLLNDAYSKNILKQVKRSLVKKAKSGKLFIDSKYTFVCPDLYAFCEWLFLGREDPDGLLKNGEVSCSLYRDGDKLDCLRSPHLYIEHCVRTNRIKEKHRKWFKGKGIYTSVKDVISKILQFDVDGDKLLVCKEKLLVKVAKRNIEKYDIVPIYYNMKKAGSMKVDYTTIYNGLILAYTGGNIGIYSNDISKYFDEGKIDNLDVVKLLCMENNFTIDYAKTLYKPIRPIHIKDLITRYTKKKVPYFFIYAKDKKTTQVEPKSNGTINRLGKCIKNPNLEIKRVAGNFRYSTLMKNPKIDITTKEAISIIEKYAELSVRTPFMLNVEDTYKSNNILYVYNEVKKELLNISDDVDYITDILVKYLYTEKKDNKKITLWECFGDVIVENIKFNLTKKFKKGCLECDGCGKLIERIHNRIKYCEECRERCRVKQNKKRCSDYYCKKKNK